MANSKVTLVNPHNGKIRIAPLGFSWTTFFFGFIPALFRSDFKWAAIQFFLALMTGGLSGFYFIFKYNSHYFKDLIKDGYVLQGSSEMAAALALKYGLPVATLTECTHNV